MKLIELKELVLEDYYAGKAKNVELEKILLNESKMRLVAICRSDEFLETDVLDEIEKGLNGVFGQKYGFSAELRIRYDIKGLPESISEIWKTYSDKFLNALKKTNHFLEYALDRAVVTENGEGFFLDLSDDIISKETAENLQQLFKSQFKEWFDRDIPLKINYHAAEEISIDRDYVFAELKPSEQKKEEKQNGKEKSKPDNKKKDGKKWKALPKDPDIFYGRSFTGIKCKMEELKDGMNDVIVSGQIVAFESNPGKFEDVRVKFQVTDFTDTLGCTIYVKENSIKDISEHMKVGSFISMGCCCYFDNYTKDICLGRVTGIKNIGDFRVKRNDNAEVKRVELHAHTKMSDMDAVNNVEEYLKTAIRWGHTAAAITDHGVVQAFPDAYHLLKDAKKKLEDEPELIEKAKDFKVIYGCEGYLVNDDEWVDEDGNPKMSEEEYLSLIRRKETHAYHIILLCRNDEGRVNLYRLVSESHLKYFYNRPRIPKSLLKKHRNGLLIGSACSEGELFDAVQKKKSKEEIDHIAELYDYYEIQPVGNNEYMIRNEAFSDIHSLRDLRKLNLEIVELADEHNKLCVATSDVHFLNPEDEVYRRIIMAGMKYKDADLQPPLFFKTTEEMISELEEYLPYEKAYEIAVTNTIKISEMIEKISPVRPDKCPPVIENSDNDLKDMCYNRAESMYGSPLPEIVKTRLDKELNSIISNGYSVMYIIAQKLVKKSNDDGYLVGSRGSVGSSFVATMSGITEVNPLQPHYYCPGCKHSEFDSPEVMEAINNQLSGFDLPHKKCPVCGKEMRRDGQNIPFETFLGFYGNKEPDIDLNFSGEYQAKAHAYTGVLFGEGHTFKAGTIGTLQEKTAYGFVKNYYADKGIIKREAEINRIVKGCVGVRRSTGQHPGGIVVLPHGEEIWTFTPVQHPANDMNTDIITTHFDYHSIDHNLLKLDILGHDDPTMIRFLEDLTGEDAKTWPMDDPKVISLFSSCEALGITEDQIGTDLGSLGLPELGTNFVMNMLRKTKPKCFSDMIRISGLSHGTDVWTGNAETLIEEGKCTLSTAICTRDDIMTYLILKGVKAGDAFDIMEKVRKGKGLSAEMEETMKANDIPDWYIWSCKKIQYMFPKAHACAYIMMAFRIAYCKIYHPLAYYAAYFSIRAKSFDYEMMAQGLDHLQAVMDIIDEKKKAKTATLKETEQYDDALCVREMYARGFEFTPIDIYEAKADRFRIVNGKLMPSLKTINGLGDIAAMQAEEEAKKGVFMSVNDYKTRTKISTSVIETMDKCGLFGNLPKDKQLSFEDFGWKLSD